MMRNKIAGILLTMAISVSATGCGEIKQDTPKKDSNMETYLTHSEYDGYERQEIGETNDGFSDGTISFDAATDEYITNNMVVSSPENGDSLDSSFGHSSDSGIEKEIIEASSDKGTENVILETDKIIYTCDLKISTDDFNESLAETERKITEYNGIIEESYFEDYTENDSRVTKRQDYKIRIPSTLFYGFIDEMGNNGCVVSKETEAANVTQDYKDYNATLEIYEEKYNRYKELLKKAKTVDEILSIEEHIYGVQDDIKWIKNKLNQINTDSAYSYVYLTVLDIDESKSANPSFGTTVKSMIKESWSSFIYFIIYVFPYALIFCVLIILIGYTGMKIRKNKK